MTFLYALFFGAGTAAIAYSTFGKRIGYTNNQNIAVFVGVIFIFTSIVFYTVLSLFISR